VAASVGPRAPRLLSGLRNLFRRTHRARVVAKRLGPRTRAVHGGRGKRRGPIVTPIYASSTWALESARQGAEFATATAPEAYYTRWGNPTLRELEEALADLESGARALATGSGMGAIASAILTCVDSGDHVVAGASLYAATTEIFTRLLPRFGVSTSFVDPRKAGAWKEAIRSDTRLVYIETPANPTMMITDPRGRRRRGIRPCHDPRGQHVCIADQSTSHRARGRCGPPQRDEVPGWTQRCRGGWRPHRRAPAARPAVGHSHDLVSRRRRRRPRVGAV